MSVNFNWAITELQCYPEFAGQTNVVYIAHWRCIGTEEANGQTYTGSVQSTREINYHDSGSYTSYEDLTEELVLSWIWDNGVNKAAVEAAITQDLYLKINPPVITLALPWTSSGDTPVTNDNPIGE
jgi:hypothetical protein